MAKTIKLRFENGVFIPVKPVDGVQEGDTLEFRVPDAVYLCESDRQAAIEQGLVVLIDQETDRESDRESDPYA
jgi:hypothetical protein